MQNYQTDIAVIGAGLAGIVAAVEAAEKGAKVALLDQEGPQSLGGQAFWSLGGLFMIDTPEQRRMGIKDSLELASQDWFGSAQFDRAEDYWPRQWAEAYLNFANGEKRAWLRERGHRILPIVGWAERGDGRADGHGNSVPRFHITWGTGPGVLELFTNRLQQLVAQERIVLLHRHMVTGLEVTDERITGAHGQILAPDASPRGVATNRKPQEDFTVTAAATIVSSGGIGGNLELVRKAWPKRLGSAPKQMVAGVPAHVDGKMIGVAQAAGAHVINPDRMWHYTEGIRNWDPVWENHGIRILPGPSSLWLDSDGKRLPAPYMPGCDTLGTLGYLRQHGHEYSWFILTQKVIQKEFALSGSEQNPDLTGRDLKLLLSRVGSKQAPSPVEKFKEHGADFIVANSVSELVAGMNKVGDADRYIDEGELFALLESRDRELANKFGKDAQLALIRNHRQHLGDKILRTAGVHAFLDPKNGPLIAVRLNILTRKTLGGLATDLQGRCLDADGEILHGLYAAGEASGFGGGGMMGYNALEGTFLGGCLFSGREAGRAAAAATS